MTQLPDCEPLERFGGPLETVLRAILPSHPGRRLGPTDLVQETLLHARQEAERFQGQTETERLGLLKEFMIRRLIAHVKQGELTRRVPGAPPGPLPAHREDAAAERSGSD